MTEMKPELVITMQPQSNLRFRYIKETGKHGVLKGRNSTIEYPTITLTVPKECNEKEFYALVILYKPTKCTQSIYWDLAAESLAVKDQTISVGPIFKLMEKHSEHIYKFSLKDYYIVRHKIEDIPNVLTTKYEEIEKIISNQNDPSHDKEKEIKFQVEKYAKTQAKQVALGFSIFTRNPDDEYKLFCGPVLSDPINDGKDIRIVKICNPKGRAGDDVTLLVSEAKKDEVEVYFFELEEHNFEDSIPKVLWDHTIEPKDLKVHQQAAISFKLPEYTGLTQDLEIHCRLSVKRPMKNDESESVSFIYERDEREVENPPKRLKFHTFQGTKVYIDSIDSKKSPLSVAKSSKSNAKHVRLGIKELINRLEDDRENVEEIIRGKFGKDKLSFKILCFKAIDSDEFLSLNDAIQKFSLERFVKNLRNTKGESLLHYACSLNKADILTPLIRLGCKIDEVSPTKRTILHLAINNKNQDCLDVVEQIFQHSYETLDIQKDLKRMLSVYDEHGFTALHRAVLSNQLTLVESILSFCKSVKTNLDRMDVLGEGDTILHLAANAGLKQMAQVIYKHDSQSVFYCNYAGKSIIDNEEAVLELELDCKL